MFRSSTVIFLHGANALAVVEAGLDLPLEEPMAAGRTAHGAFFRRRQADFVYRTESEALATAGRRPSPPTELGQALSWSTPIHSRRSDQR